VEEMLRAFVNYKQNDWDTHLPLVEFAYNNSTHASTGITPFWANYQQNPLTPAVFIKTYDVKQASSVKDTEDLLQDSNAIIRIIQD
jgi:hypothetical protein